jgi:hypothetical protein
LDEILSRVGRSHDRALAGRDLTTRERKSLGSREELGGPGKADWYPENPEMLVARRKKKRKTLLSDNMTFSKLSKIQKQIW